MNWLTRLLRHLHRAEPLLPPELHWRLEILSDKDGEMHVLVSNYDGTVPDLEIYVAGAQLSVEAAKRAGLGPDVLLGALAQKYLKPTLAPLSGKKIIVAR